MRKRTIAALVAVLVIGACLFLPGESRKNVRHGTMGYDSLGRYISGTFSKD